MKTKEQEEFRSEIMRKMHILEVKWMQAKENDEKKKLIREYVILMCDLGDKFIDAGEAIPALFMHVHALAASVKDFYLDKMNTIIEELRDSK